MKDLIGFCNRITPVNWHVATHPQKYVFMGPGTLNIFFRILDHFVDGWIYAFKKGSMKFYPVSRYRDCSDAKESFEKYGEHFVAESEIWLYPQGCKFFGDDSYAAMVHELAHVAVDRWVAFKAKAYRTLPEEKATEKRLHHGEEFCRAFETFIRRVDKFGGDDSKHILNSLRLELNSYLHDLKALSNLNEWAGRSMHLQTGKNGDRTWLIDADL
jgi:hypothetical protein